MALLKLDNVSVTLDGETLLDGVSFSIGKGQRVGLIGAAGSGKSLLLRAVLGLLPPSATMTGGIIFVPLSSPALNAGRPPAFTMKVFTGVGLIGSVEPCGGEGTSGAVTGIGTGAAAVCIGVGVRFSCFICATASSFGSVRSFEATRMYLASSSRIRASRQLPEAAGAVVADAACTSATMPELYAAPGLATAREVPRQGPARRLVSAARPYLQRPLRAQPTRPRGAS